MPPEVAPHEVGAIRQRRIKLAMINPPDFMALFKKGGKIRTGFKVIKGLPADAKILNIAYDNMRGAICVIVESETFDEVEVGVLPPNLPVEIDVGYKKK